METIYTNLPDKDPDSLQQTITKLTTTDRVEPFQMNQNDLDVAIGFFVKRGFDRAPAEQTAYVILQQTKIASVNPQEILDQLTKATPAQLSELITVILNANRYKSSRLGVRNQRTQKTHVSRNIIT